MKKLYASCKVSVNKLHIYSWKLEKTHHLLLEQCKYKVCTFLDINKTSLHNLLLESNMQRHVIDVCAVEVQTV